MCFSPQADLVGGLVIGIIAADVVLHVHRRRDHLAFAALPLLLALHNLTETFVWWGLRGQVRHWVGAGAAWVYLLFAFVVLPMYLPLAIRALEPAGRRRTVISGFVALGAVVSGVLLAAMIRGPVTAREAPHHISYSVNLPAGLLIVGAYVVATCASAVFSGYRHIAIYGVVNLVGVAVLAKLEVGGFASLWCGWAALTSLAIALELRYGARPRTRRIWACPSAPSAPRGFRAEDAAPPTGGGEGAAPPSEYAARRLRRGLHVRPRAGRRLPRMTGAGPGTPRTPHAPGIQPLSALRPARPRAGGQLGGLRT